MKIAVLGSIAKPVWLSCVFIEENLIRSYQLLRDQHEIIFLSVPVVSKEDDNWPTLNQQTQQLLQFQPDCIVLVSHSLHPYLTLNWLSSLPELGKAQIFVHCYGDFSMQWPWMEIANRKWNGLKIRFLVASEASLQMHRAVLENKAAVSVCPFPIDESLFHATLETEQDLHFRLIYTGRLSIQKNINEMVRLVSKWSSDRQIPTRLDLIGDFDLTGAYFFSKRMTPHLYPSAILSSHQESRFLSLQWKPTTDSKTLASLYRQSDAFISLSMHHDEDFGMSPAEALCSGLPCVLSSWGGFHDFFQSARTFDEPSVFLCDFQNDVGGIYLDLKEGFRALDQAYALKRHSGEKKQARARHFQSHFSLQAVREKLGALLQVADEPFRGFDLAVCKQIFDFQHHQKTQGFSFRDPVYRKLYEGYFSGNR